MLQRGGGGATVWGFATTGSKVAVNFASADYSAVADANGVWRVKLAPLAAGGPYTLTVTSSSATVTVTDILMGDVYM